MTIHKKGQAHWEGDIKRGKGTVSTESGVLNQQPYGFNTRFEGEKGTNPEELIGAAHAALHHILLKYEDILKRNKRLRTVLIYATVLQKSIAHRNYFSVTANIVCFFIFIHFY
ncbi:OsmC family peroxiredoxin [Escherichia coli]|nr:OsmC family peroxiredoxin [Escherichia coli]WKA87278.1 OsmC family peroxiredoxin [Escherichia coli]